ncbi:hypothetical protein JKY72_04690 [Candidatus Gracilibacteria bacterium]|nr:hypothetical protein [Candidatus Gracilibacteria bacterium]
MENWDLNPTLEEITASLSNYMSPGELKGAKQDLQLLLGQAENAKNEPEKAAVRIVIEGVAARLDEVRRSGHKNISGKLLVRARWQTAKSDKREANTPQLEDIEEALN